MVVAIVKPIVYVLYTEIQIILHLHQHMLAENDLSD